TQGADKVRLWTAQTGGTAIPAAGTTIVGGGSPQTYWIEAFAPSASMADIAFTLTPTGGSPASADRIRATAVDNVISIKAIDDKAHEQFRDTGTFVITRESGRLDTTIPVQIIVSGDAGYGWQYELTPDLPPLVPGQTHRSSINLLPGVDRLIVTLTPLRENKDNRERKAVLEVLTPQIPLYAVAKGYDKAEVTIIPDPQRGDLLITGTITYEGPTGIDGSNSLTLDTLPVRGAKVEIRDQGINGDVLLATAYTDDNGKYAAWISSQDPTPGGGDVDPFVIVVAQSAPESIAVIAHEVSIPGGSSPARKVFADNVVPRGPGRAVLDGALSDTGAAVNSDTNAAFSVFDAIYSFSRYHVNLPGVASGTVKARVRAPADQNDTSEYSGGEIEVIRPDRFSWDTIGHEYGHFAHEHAGVALASGPHYLSENLRFHRGTAAWRLAFTEGFATYFSIVAQLRTPKPPSGVAGYGDTIYWDVDNLAVRGSTDIAAEGPSIPAGTLAKFGSLGEDNEVSVFRTLWDLYDPANNDPIGDIGDIGLWRLVTTGSAQAKPYFKSLYRDLITNVNIERRWDIGRVVADHKIVPAPLRVDLGGATTASESIDHPPTFFISTLY
ncbi:MAG: hypothetical protein ACK5SI_17855, partial [Planctomycetia bacterium]